LEIGFEEPYNGVVEHSPLRRSLSRARCVFTALAAGLFFGSVAPAWPQTGDPYAAYQRGDFDAAARGFAPLAHAGDRDAQYALGILYELGRGVERDLLAAVDWYRRSAAQGLADAQFNLAAMYANGEGVSQDLVAAYALLALAAAQGHAEAAKQRHTVARKLTSEQIAEAQQLAAAAHRWMNPRPPAGQSAEDRKQPSGDAAGRRDTLADGLVDEQRDPIFGNPKGNVTVVEFFDYRCPDCRKVAERLLTTVEEDGNIRLVFKELPIQGSRSEYAARAALAANNQGKYLDFHKALMRATGRLTRTQVQRIALSLGLDMHRLRADMRSPEIKGAIAANRSLAKNLGIKDTPTLIIADRTVRGDVTMTSLHEHVAEAR